MEKCSCYEKKYMRGLSRYAYDDYAICNGTKEQDRCTCEGDRTKCDFFPEKRDKANIEKIDNRRLKIYYAHHQWKYGTEIEEYELNLIRSYFPSAWIFNPSTHLNIDGKTEDEIMKRCLDQVRRSDILVFSSVDGVVGIGVFKEFEEAQINYKPCFYIQRDKLWTNVDVSKNINSTSDRTYGLVTLVDLDQ